MNGVVQFCPLFSEAEAARRLGVSIDTVRRERKRKNIGFVMIGRGIRYTDKLLNAYLEARTIKPCRNENTKDGSENTGSLNTERPRIGTGRGSTAEDVRHAVSVLERTISKKRTSS